MVKAFTLQIGVNIVEALLVENQCHKNTFPTVKILRVFSFFRYFSDEGAGAQLKNVGIREAKSSVTAVFEADSPPDPHSLYQLCKSLSGSKNKAAAPQMNKQYKQVAPVLYLSSLIPIGFS